MVRQLISNLNLVWLMSYISFVRSFSTSGKTFSLKRSKTLITQSASFSSKISISDAYDGGNIEHVNQNKVVTEGKQEKNLLVSLRIKPDPYTELEKVSHMQYFSFRSTLHTPDDESNDDHDDKISVKYQILNAGEASYSKAWDGSTVFYSKTVGDPDSWRREETTRFEHGSLVWDHVYSKNSESVYFSYFPPFSYARHLDLVEKCSKYSDVFSLGQTLEGRELECVRVGTGESIGWIIHRQHPGEHMAEFYAEGLLKRLVGYDSQGDTDGLVRRLLSMYTLYVVPSMNPDGAAAGHLRTNAGGANLNREWCDSVDKDYSAPSLKRSPEVYHVLEKMKETGCNVFCDIHGDEEIPYNFLAQPCVPNWGLRLKSLHGAFLAAYCRANPDMQQDFGYEPSEFVEGDTILNIANDQIAHRFDCLSVTLEMPFKDCWSNPDAERGWSPARSRSLGASLCEPLFYIHSYLHLDEDDETFFKKFPEHDQYILPTSLYRR
mmetsp:Transcript_12575/g.13471  ORF Transcript_12575/g.13471 Transcript_12575/m.13471 type:complete len:492 (+) Transcript_12575:10-1485(+)